MMLDALRVILQVIQALAALSVLGLVMLHSPKGDGLGGIGGAAQMFASQKGAEATLNKITAIAIGVFFVVSFVLGYYL